VKIPSERIQSIDAFRGVTIFAMIFVNELAGVGGIPGWMKHAAADEDAMTFVDVVFPAFLFIVGMSMPFAIQRRLDRGESKLKVTMHTLWRGLALIVMGVFMVNAEGDYDEAAMRVSIHAWSLLFYLAVVLVWVDWKISNKLVVYAFRATGILVLILLAFEYRGAEGGHIKAHWWGILGLIGWAYLISFCFYMIVRGKRFGLISGIALGIGYYVLGHFAFRGNVFYQHPLLSQSGHATHVVIVLSGILLSLFFFQRDLLATSRTRLVTAAWYFFVMLVVAVVLRPLFGISKIYATPAWAAFSIAICIAVFALIFLLVEEFKLRRWMNWLLPSASNPLVAYMIPYVVYAGMKAVGISWPAFLYQGWEGILWCLIYAGLVMVAGGWLTRRGMVIRL
jgi:heparan-alpha-glucosaminide N-acetyltransferase